MKAIARVFALAPALRARRSGSPRLGRGPARRAGAAGWTAMRDLPRRRPRAFRDWWRPRAASVPRRRREREIVSARARRSSAASAARSAAGADGPRGARATTARRRSGARRRVVDRFCERVAEYRATVRRVAAADAGRRRRAPRSHRGARVVVPPGLAVAAGGPRARRRRPPLLGPRELDGLDGVLTGCALAIADTGTIVLDGSRDLRAAGP